ncbi:hypothetical protein AT6N2_C3147 [Agrobacterium tumefaciens]|nr:hypothetical protein AT6N2_C3147 [Agrobacterium tumefaciens]
MDMEAMAIPQMAAAIIFFSISYPVCDPPAFAGLDVVLSEHLVQRPLPVCDPTMAQHCFQPL